MRAASLWFWLIAGSMVTLAALGASTSGVVNLLARDEERFTRSYAAASLQRLDVDGDNGAIEITAREGVDTVQIEMVVSHGFQRTRHQQTEANGVLRLSSSCPVMSSWCHVDYRISVPLTTALAIDVAVKNGSLVMRDVVGEVDVVGRNGSIELVRLGGQVRVRSENGSIDGSGLRSEVVDAETRNGRVDLGFADPPTRVLARSQHGRIDLELPDERSVAYRVRTDTDHGSTDVTVRTDPSSDRSITATTSNGPIAVRYQSG